MASKVSETALKVRVDGSIDGLKKAMADASEVMKSTQRSLTSLNKSLKLDPTNIDLLQQKQDLLKKSVAETTKTLNKFREMEKEVDEQGVDKTSEDYQKLQLGIEECVKSLKKMKAEISTFSPEFQKTLKEIDKVGDSLETISQKTRAMSTAFAALGVSMIKEAVDYESQIASIKKVITDLSDETVSGLKKVAVETGSAFNDIAEYATIAGTLGIAQQNIESFTKAMVDLNTATDGSISGEEGAKAVARFLNVLNIGTDQAGNFGSAITYVGDQFAATADEILEVSTTLAGLSSFVDVNQFEMIGLAAEMKNLGLKTQTSGSAITKAFMKINNSVETSDKYLKEFAKAANMTSKEFQKAWGEDSLNTFLKFTDGLKDESLKEIGFAVDNNTEKLKEFAKVAGMSSEQFKKAWAKDANSTFDAYVKGLEKLEDESESASLILSNVQLSGVRVAETLLKLAGNGDVVRKAIQDAETAWINNTALTDKAGRMYETTAYKLKGMWESLKQAGATIGTSFLPVMQDATDIIKEFSEWVKSADENTLKTVATLITMGAAFSPIVGGLGKAAKGFVSATTYANKFIKIKKGLSDVAIEFPNLANAIDLAGGSFASLSWTAVGVGAAIAAVTAYIKYQNTEAVQAKKAIGEYAKELDNAAKSADDLYRDTEAKVAMMDYYAGSIDKLLEKLKEQGNTEKEVAETKEQITNLIDNLNSALGAEAFAFDEATGKLTYQGQEIDRISEKYDNLAAKVRQSAWLSAHENELSEAYKQMEEYPDKIDTLWNDYNEKASKYTENVREKAEELANAVFNGELGKSALYTQDASGLARQYYDVLTAVQDASKGIEDCNKVIENYEKVAAASLEEVDSILQSISEGTKTVFEPAQMSIEELRSQIDELEAQKEIYLSASSEDGEDWASQQAVAIQEQIDAMEEVLRKKADEMEINKEIANDLLFSNQMILEDRERVANLSEEYAKASADSTVDYINGLQLEPKYVDVFVRVHDSQNILGGASGSYSGFDSGGFSAPNLPMIRSEISKTLSNAKYRSGGFASGSYSITPTINISVTNGMTINEARGIASAMVDTINEELGRLL